jgi:predicted lipoprotein with Yx(FWY)xxD motif
MAQDATESAMMAGPVQLTIAQSDTLGPYIADANGMTLYTFDVDAVGTSNCYDRCAQNWPPVLVDSADNITADAGIPGALGTTTRTDGTLQVTYNGWPLYYWIHDEAPGDTTGQGVGRVWWIQPPATTNVSANETLGKYLVGPNGMTVYTFDNDTEGVSNCADQCAENWPPVTVASADDLVAGVNQPGEWGTIERADGTLQVTYNGWPLYYFAQDAAIGDTTGDGRGDVWHIVKPEAVDASGEYLADFTGRTLYTFDNDTEGVSNCADDCAEAWPPYTVRNAADIQAPAGFAGTLGTIERADGSMQVTLDGKPLYFFQDDKAPGDANGDGAGGVWHAAPGMGEM